MRPRRSLARTAAAVSTAALLVACGLVVGAAPANAAVPADNPSIPRQCGLGVTLVLDASGSVQSSNAVGSVRTAADAFLDAFTDTGSTARVLQFATFSEQLAPRTIVDGASLGGGGVLADAVAGYYNPIPPRPSGSTIHRFNGGSISNPASYTTSNSSNQYTNWQQVLDDTSADAGDYVIFITDGDPTAYDFGEAGDPFPAPDVAVGTDRTAASAAETLDRAVTSANVVKASGARVLALGVGEALQNSASVQRLTQVSGPEVVDDMADFDVETTDVALVRDFDQLADAVRTLVLDLCSPSLTIRKLAQSADDAAYVPAEGWDMTVTPTVAGGSFDWVLPSGAAGPSSTVSTNADGFAQFQWEPDPGDALSDADVVETMEPDFLPGRPGPDNDYRCEFRDAEGNLRIVEGELEEDDATASFSLTGIAAEIGTCSVFNSFDYQSAIALEKVNSPTVVRGDLDGGALVTSTYTATNPGNAPLAQVELTDDQCDDVTAVTAPGGDLNVGDADQDTLLDPGEEWLFTCGRNLNASAGAPGPQTIENVATVSGVDPTGAYRFATATAEVDLYVPLITLDKLANGADEVTVVPGTTVTYTYRAENVGETSLSGIVIADDTPPCETPVRGADDPGDGDDVMAVGEVWTWSCDSAVSESVINVATVAGTPLNPDSGVAFPEPNPPVSATDEASVEVTTPELLLVKTVDQNLVFPGTTVDYTYEATNTSVDPAVDLRNDTGVGAWVTDDTCPGVAQTLAGGFNVGDVNTDGLMNPGETWQFTCSMPISDTTVNTAEIIAQPLIAGEEAGAELVRTDQALVEVITPAIDLRKLAVRGVVLDPDATPVAGPDVPDVRPAEYVYAVRNTGQAPLRDVVLGDDKCAPVTLLGGDEGDDGILAVGETWAYECATVLERQQGTPPPLGAESSLVNNTATVTATPYLPTAPGVEGEQVQDSDLAQVLVTEPSLVLTKTPSAPVVRPGDTVTYTFAVTNTGDVGLDPIAINDDKCVDIEFVGGDLRQNGLIDGANGVDGVILTQPETWTFTCSRVIEMPPDGADADENVATVTAFGTLGNVYGADASATVTVIDPAIRLEKAVSEVLVPAGTTVDYSFDVTNVGRSPVAADDVLAQISLSDVSLPANPACANPVFVGGDDDGDGLLAREPAEVWHHECSGVITEQTVDLAGVAGVGGTTFGLEIPVYDFDAEVVQPFHPALTIEKSATPTLVVAPGGNVTYGYAVRNTGDVPLANVAETIQDDRCAPLTYLSGDLDEDGLLDTPTSIFEDAADETWLFSCTAFIAEDTVNTVIVTGSPVDAGGVPLCGAADAQALARVLEPCDVSATDTATVTVAAPLPPTGASAPWTALWVAVATMLGGFVLWMWGRGRRAARR
ncbi:MULTISPECIES: vWA domain-containing protein [Microbacterium]|uniref:vWA domain-containing protein n=1 Tax=Microbacterium TaxID=33882 RepID=UPI0013A54DFB|nr:vWA domain-containing protein [Microbacterium sp. KCTC 39802]